MSHSANPADQSLPYIVISALGNGTIALSKTVVGIAVSVISIVLSSLVAIVPTIIATGPLTTTGVAKGVILQHVIIAKACYIWFPILGTVLLLVGLKIALEIFRSIPSKGDNNVLNQST